MELDIAGIFTQLGVAGLFVYLYMTERARTSKARNEHVRDLRYIASINHERLGAQWNGLEYDQDEHDPEKS